jgi:hypothetical protein
MNLIAQPKKMKERKNNRKHQNSKRMKAIQNLIFLM